MIIASFWVLRPEEHPEAAARNYPGMLRVLQRSCDALGLHHLVLTDHETAASPLWPSGVEAWATDLPSALMRATTEAQARYLESAPHDDVLFCGADCILLKDPAPYYPKDPGLCVTYRRAGHQHPINTGAVVVRRHSMGKVAALYRRVADRCGTEWCDDQRALGAELAPLPAVHGVYDRGGLHVAFLTLEHRNVTPNPFVPHKSAQMLHFRGKSRKKWFFMWTKNFRPEWLA